MKTFPQLLQDELVNARLKHPTNIHNVHEGYSVILEEIDEYWEWVKRKTKNREPEEMLKELIQIAAMAQRTAEDVVIPMIKEK
jgi:NTP pyrophosphatase (non-canonical NTP hydrolase)